MNEEERDSIWAQLSALATGLNRLSKQLDVIRARQVRTSQRLERLEDRETLNKIRVVVEFDNEKAAKEFSEYVREEKDVAIPVSQKPGEDKFIRARLIED